MLINGQFKKEEEIDNGSAYMYVSSNSRTRRSEGGKRKRKKETRRKYEERRKLMGERGAWEMISNAVSRYPVNERRV